MSETVFDPVPVTLEGYDVRLEPLALSHAEDLLAAGEEPEIWRYLPRPSFESLADTRHWIESAREEMDRRCCVAFAIIERASTRAVGSTRYMDIRRPHRGLEIGYTWIAPSHQRTAVNTACKRLLLGHAFEALGALRVQLKTDLRNVQSQRALERIAAVREGVLRHHMVTWDGHVRDTLYFSVLDTEWPRVRDHLNALLALA